jgi:hypothetical protein
MSQQRRCDVWKANNGKWYLMLGDFEYAEEESDCTTYGPFNDYDDVELELDNHSNPGGQWVDESGEKDPPTRPKRPSGYRSRFR